MTEAAGDSASDALEELYRYTTSLDDPVLKEAVWVLSTDQPQISLKLDAIQKTVKDGGWMDTDSLNLAIRKMAREESSDGNLKNSKPYGYKRYFSSDFARYAISKQDGDTNLETCVLDEFVHNASKRDANPCDNSKPEVLCIPVIHGQHSGESYYGVHWTLYAFNMDDHKLSILDSKLERRRHEGIGLKVWTVLESVKTKSNQFENKSSGDFSSWTSEFADVPQQDNGNDCGFLVFNFMRHWDGHKLDKSLIPTKSKELRKEFLAYILSFKDNKALELPPRLSQLIKNLPSGPAYQKASEKMAPPSGTAGVRKRPELVTTEDQARAEYELRREAGLAENRVREQQFRNMASVMPSNNRGPARPRKRAKKPTCTRNDRNGGYYIRPRQRTYGEDAEATIAIPSTSETIESTRAPLYKVVPVTKILVKPCKALKSPFLMKRQSFLRPDAKILEDLYRFTITTTLPVWQRAVWVSITEPYLICLRLEDIQKSVKDGESMDIDCLNLAVRNMGREDAHGFRNTKCLGWRHYVDSDWAVRSLSGCSGPMDLKRMFYRGSVLYNASQSHMVFIPVLHGDHWTLYAFNMCDQKLSILDSLPDATKGGDDPTERHQKTRCNVCDALTLTMNFAIDFRSWEYQFPKVPRQQNSCDSGFFVFNFMRLWDGHQLVRWFPIESRELRKDFLAYILSCKDNNVGLPDEVSRWIQVLSGKPMMDLTLQKVASEGGTPSTENPGEHGGVGPNNPPSEHTAIAIDPVLGASAESSNEHFCFFNAHWNPSREAPATSSAPDPPLASSALLSRYDGFTFDGDGVLHIAASFGNLELVRQIRETDGALAAALLAAVNNRGDTPLHCAAAGGSEKMVDLFVKDMMRGDTGIAKFLRAKNLDGETCLHEAVRHGHAGVVKTLILEDKKLEDLSSPALVQIVDNEGISPLYLATTLRRIEIVKDLINNDKYVASCAGPAGKTALHAAVVLLDKELIEILLEWNKGLTREVDESGSTPLHFLAPLCLERRKLNKSLHILLDGRFSLLSSFQNILPNLNLRYILLNSFQNAQDSGIVELILRKEPLSAFYADSTGSLPIHVAAAHGRLEIIKKMLKECPYCESSRNASGQTFLHVAVEKKKVEIVVYVCRANKFARILNAKDQDGNTALHLAVNNASEKIFCTLMRNRDVGLSFANKEGRTPLDLAFLSLHPKVIGMQEPRKLIFFDLLHGGGDFGICSWDRLVGNVVEPDWEKESERVGKSASMLAVCAVLILNAALVAPFNVLSRLDKLPYSKLAFQAFVISNFIAFMYSAAATFFCARAGFAMVDGLMRLKNLCTGIFDLVAAALALVPTVSLALFLVLPKGTRLVPLFLGVLGITAMVFGLVASKVKSTVTHLRAIRARIGTLPLASILLFQRSAIEPLWEAPTPSLLFYALAFCVLFFIGLLLVIAFYLVIILFALHHKKYV